MPPPLLRRHHRHEHTIQLREHWRGSLERCHRHNLCPRRQQHNPSSNNDGGLTFSKKISKRQQPRHKAKQNGWDSRMTMAATTYWRQLTMQQQQQSFTLAQPTGSRSQTTERVAAPATGRWSCEYYFIIFYFICHCLLCAMQSATATNQTTSASCNHAQMKLHWGPNFKIINFATLYLTTPSLAYSFSCH